MFIMESSTKQTTIMFQQTSESAINASILPSVLVLKKNNSVINSSVMFTVGVLSNLLALLVLQRTDCDHKRKLFYRLVAGLTLTDLVGIVALSPVVLSTYANDFKWTGGDALCQYFAFMMVLAGTATMTIVCLMAVERLLCIHHPYLYFTRLRKRHATFFLIGAWLFSAIIATLPLLGLGRFTLQYPGTWCFLDHYTYDTVDRGFNYLFAILALCTISVTFTCNVIVLNTLLKTKMRGRSRCTNENSRTFCSYSRRYSEFQMAVLLIGITVVFSACYLPLLIRILINQTRLLPEDRELDLLVIRFASLNQILDPWVYILLRREMVCRLVSTLKSIFGQSSGLTQEFHLKTIPTSANLVSEQEGQQTCCSFCWHCLCDPPPSQIQTRSFLGPARGTVCSKRSQLSPTVMLAMRSAQNGILLTNALSKDKLRDQNLQNGSTEVKFKNNEEMDDDTTVTSQPSSYLNMSVLLNKGEQYTDLENVSSTLLVNYEYENK